MMSEYEDVFPEGPEDEYDDGVIFPSSPAEERGNDPVEKAPMLVIDTLATLNDKVEAFVYIPMWDAKVKIRALTAHQMETIRKRCGDRENEQYSHRLQKYLVQAAVVDPRIDDRAYNILLSKSFKSVNMIVTRILELGGLKDVADHDERVKRFPSGQ
jgi:hypothetical protein